MASNDRKTAKKKKEASSEDGYRKFDTVNGLHPWQKAVDNSYVLYPVRELNKGSVLYFNFDLAKEMGLVPNDHPNRLVKSLEDKIIETFSIRIVNEYDQINKIDFPKDSIKKHKFMATRYLQLQHANKSGATSGDGRSIWNGYVRHKGKVWDVSSRGTGVTCLAPGAVEAGKPLQTGDESFGYGCGLAEMDELVATAILAEVYHKQGIYTERMLAIIDLGGGLGIGVRAGTNLVRPAHLFRLLKQKDLSNLKKAVDYVIERQAQNNEWKINPKSATKYNRFLKEVTNSFATFAAILEVDYIFAWLDWDGDNVLINAGIIDYGSIRQFGLKHDQYRYEDTDRFSTTLSEQRRKARETIQVFAQLIDYVKTKEKKPLTQFQNDNSLTEFDQIFETERKKRILYRSGFREKEIKKLMQRHSQTVEQYCYYYSNLERVKTSSALKRTEDGVNRPAILSVKDGIRYLTEVFEKEGVDANVELSRFFDVMLASTANSKDRKVSSSIEKNMIGLVTNYQRLVLSVAGRRTFKRMMKDINARSKIINRKDRITGNSITIVTQLLIKAMNGKFDARDIQKSIDTLIAAQVLTPEGGLADPEKTLRKHKKTTKRLLKSAFKIVEDYSDDI